MKTATEILENKTVYIGVKEITGLKEDILQAMEEYASQFSTTVKVTDEEIDINELKDCVLNILQQVETTTSRSGNTVIADIDDNVDSIFRIFSPYLEPSKTDAIEFAEWIDNNFWIRSTSDNKWYHKTDGNIDSGDTTSELYTLFLQSNINK